MIKPLFLLLVVVALVLMGLRRRAFLGWGRIEMTALMVLPLVEYAWIVIAPWPGRAGLSLGVLAMVIICLGVGIAWRRYIASSQRVAATFVR